MSLDDDLFTLEQGFWLSGKDHFLDHLDDNCLLAFPQAGQMHGVYSRQQVADSVSSAPDRWRNLQITDRQLLHLDDVAIISYRADVTRPDGQPYAALVGSTYVKRPDGWKLAAHQHSPIEQ